jgi:Flp pilus assembly pilin Flp
VAPSCCEHPAQNVAVHARGDPLRRLIRILRGERGQDNVEYALLAACIALLVLGMLLCVRPNVKRAYEKIHRAFTTSPEGTGDRGGGTPADG